MGSGVAMRVLILASFDGRVRAALGAWADVVYEPWLETGRLCDPVELGERLDAEGFDALVIEADFVCEETFDAAPGLRFVGVCRGEIGPHVDLVAAAARNVVVTHTPGRNAVAVAELAVGLMLALARRIPAADRAIRDGAWHSAVDNLAAWQGTELAGRTAGLIGCGAVGREVARRLLAFGMRLLVFDPPARARGAPAEPGLEWADLQTLLAESDVVSLHAALCPGSRGLLGPAELARMTPSAFLVNTARAALVDEAALLAALQAGRIAGAALDVHVIEPLPATSPWLRLDNVILTPHIGGASSDAIRRHSELIAAELGRYVQGQPLRYQVAP